MKYERSRIKARRSQLLKDPNLTDKERKKITDKYTQMLLDRAKQIEEYVKASELPKELK